jgi:uncharacterized protein YfaS (alpha-2-macroglobulin family)
VSITNAGTSPVYAHLRITGSAPPGTEKASSNGITLAVAYRSTPGVDGSGAADLAPQIRSRTLPPGTDMEVSVTVTNTWPTALESVALVHYLPANWEVLTAAPGEKSALADYQDIRDDAVMTYFGLNVGERKTFTYRVTTTFTGTYALPPLRAYAMYDESIQAVVP